MKKMYFIICLLINAFAGIHSAGATTVIITAQTTPFEAFLPQTANAVCGDTIKWMNTNGQHTTASTTIPNGALPWNSPTINAGGYIYVVTVAGTYNYTCHPLTGGHMDASIVVTCATGISSVEPALISAAWPNPFTRSITIETTANADRIIFYNILGSAIKTVWLKQGQISVEIDAAEFTNGIYFYSIVKKDMILETRKIVKM